MEQQLANTAEENNIPSLNANQLKVFGAKNVLSKNIACHDKCSNQSKLKPLKHSVYTGAATREGEGYRVLVSFLLRA